ncbi:MAG TPA: hypothetical protein PLJ00_15020 [Chitinophagales bacterium]|nr:hypothetical protein [Chitinophagales bacterium]
MKYFIFLSPILIALELVAFSQITSLLRAQSDVAVFAGVVFTGIFLAANYFIYKLIKKSKR